MRLFTFAKRCGKEIFRDPLNLMFGIAFPIVLMLLLSLIQANIPVELFEIEKLAPGITVFGLSFMTLFSATLVARDRETSLLQRLYTTPLKPADYILGYMLPLVPMAAVQSIGCYTVAVVIGMPIEPNIIYAVIAVLPISVLYIALGLLCGTVFNVKQVGGICGALLTNLSAWLSGIWFDIKLVGGVFEKIAKVLPFLHAVETEKAIIGGNFDMASEHIAPVLIYAVFITAAAVFMFLRQMKKQ